MSEAFDRGLEIFGEVYGKEAADGLKAHVDQATGFGHMQATWSMEWAFGSVWARDGLSRKMRSCAVLGMVIGQKQFEEIRYHTKMGLANGLTRQEIEEIFYSAIPYCGFPASATAKAAILQGFKDLEEMGKAAE